MHACADRDDTGSHLKQIDPPTPGGLGGYLFNVPVFVRSFVRSFVSVPSLHSLDGAVRACVWYFLHPIDGSSDIMLLQWQVSRRYAIRYPSDNIIIKSCTINTFLSQLIIHCYSLGHEINILSLATGTPVKHPPSALQLRAPDGN